jgi:hypothetical protein
LILDLLMCHMIVELGDFCGTIHALIHQFDKAWRTLRAIVLWGQAYRG